MKVLYEDNHIIIVSKKAGEIVQGDKTGDIPLSETIKLYLKNKYNKPGNVFLGVVHRLDRPVSGVVLFARTSKALPRLNKLFADHQKVKKVYFAIVRKKPEKQQGSLTHWITRNEKANKSKAYDREVPNSKKATLDYEVIATSDKYFLLRIHLHTGRHHQIRCQLAAIGCPIRGDLKYGYPRSNSDGSISLHSREIELEHPVSHQVISVKAPLPEEKLWQVFSNLISE